jgi:hypothetical protein
MSSSVVSGVIMGQLELYLAGSTVTVDANAKKFTSELCQKTIRGLKSVSDITCVREDFDENSQVGSYLFTLNKYPMAPFMNNLMSHTGNPPLSAFRCNTSLVDKEEAQGALCVFEDVVTENLPREYQV